VDPRYEIAFKVQANTFGNEWIELLKDAYIWFDWFSIPQSSSAMNDRVKAIRSIRSYITKSSFVLVLAPGCVHEDKIDTRTNHKACLGYRTWRLKAKSVLEMYLSFFLRKFEEESVTKNVLLVQSVKGEPQWLPDAFCMRLRVGLSDFDTSFGDRVLARNVLSFAIKYKVALFRTQGKILLYRFFICLRRWFLHNLAGGERVHKKYLKQVRQLLLWGQGDKEWIDRDGISILVYLALLGNVTVMKQCLESLPKVEAVLEQPVKTNKLTCFGIIPSDKVLKIAMQFSSPEIVSLLLDHGANPNPKSPTGYASLSNTLTHTRTHTQTQNKIYRFDNFMVACMMNNINNVTFWLKRFPEYDFAKATKPFGAHPLGVSMNFGPRRMDLVKILFNEKTVRVCGVSGKLSTTYFFGGLFTP